MMTIAMFATTITIVIAIATATAGIDRRYKQHE
jgi:hypothetical protein